jgi:hypothetical protein
VPDPPSLADLLEGLRLDRTGGSPPSANSSISVSSPLDVVARTLPLFTFLPLGPAAGKVQEVRSNAYRSATSKMYLYLSWPSRGASHKPVGVPKLWKSAKPRLLLVPAPDPCTLCCNTCQTSQEVICQANRAYIRSASRLSIVTRSGTRTLKNETAEFLAFLFLLASQLAIRFPIHAKRPVWSCTTNWLSNRCTMASCAPRRAKQDDISLASAIVFASP